jgi:LPXTG-site transpeptidase (sortase) family protein
MNSLYNVVDRIWKKKLSFISVFFVIFTLSYATLFVFDFLPEVPTDDSSLERVPDATDSGDLTQGGEDNSQGTNEEGSVTTEMTEEYLDQQTELTTVIGTSQVELPITISIGRLNKTITVLNPISRAISDLDEALLSGVVRHPDSAALTQEGNMFILGHSSYLPNVFNKNFQAFNGIQNLEWGDIIEVFSEDIVYEYRVDKVYRANAQELTVPIAGTGHQLTLATCNSFGSVDDRYIVEATRIGAKSV